MSAFILQKIEKNIVYWKYVTDKQKILIAPVSDVIFVDEDDDKNFTFTFEKIKSKYPTDENLEKYPIIFKNDTCHGTTEIQIDLNPARIQKMRYYHHKQTYWPQLAKYVKDSGKPLGYKQLLVPYEPFSPQAKNELNDLGIYIRPKRKELEYDPVLAIKQKNIRNRKPSKAIPAFGVRLNDLTASSTALHHIFEKNLNVELRYGPAMNYGRGYTKFQLADDIVFMVKMFNVFFRKNAYRSLQRFDYLKKAWAKTPDEKKKAYSPNFFDFMEAEAKLKSPKKLYNDFWPKFEPKGIL